MTDKKQTKYSEQQPQTKYSEQDIKDLKDLVSSREAQGVDTSLDLIEIDELERGVHAPNGSTANKADALLRHHKKDIARRDKRIADYYNGPVSRREIAQTYATKADCKSMSQLMDVMLTVIKKGNLVTDKGLEKLFQEVQLKEHPDLCNSCSKLLGKQCSIAPEGDVTAIGGMLAKEKLKDLTGKKAKQVIHCGSYESKGLTEGR